MSGYVRITSISDLLSQRLEKIAAASLSDAGQGDQTLESQDHFDLEQIFSVGQFLRAFVISTGRNENPGVKAKKHIELSLRPQQANLGLSVDDCIEHSMIQAAVTSIEDHGVVMDFGLQDTTVKGFVPLDKLGSGTSKPAVQIGGVFLCIVIKKPVGGKIITLSADSLHISNIKKGAYLTDLSSVESLLPGNAIDVLVTDVAGSGFAGKFMGLVDVTADLFHGRAPGPTGKTGKKVTVGNKVRGRVLFTIPSFEGKKIGISLQDHVVYWRPKTTSHLVANKHSIPTTELPISAVVEEAKVLKVEAGVGLFLDVNIPGVDAFAHISRLSDKKIDSISDSTGPYRIGSVHKCRVIGYNLLDGIFIVSLESTVIEQPFLRFEDVQVGSGTQVKIERLLNTASGVLGAIVELANGITGFVPEMHFADVRLQNPERKFRDGAIVSARVLAKDPIKRRIRLTLKKSLINDDAEPWIDYNRLSIGMRGRGTLINIISNGAVVQFYGDVRAFLPVAEMSETFIKDPREHFQKGQVVNIHILSLSLEKQQMTVSCRDHTATRMDRQEAIKALTVGSIASGKVIEKTLTDLVVSMEPHDLRSTLSIEHLADGSMEKASSTAKRIRVGQDLTGLLIISTNPAKGAIRLTSKPSLLKAAQDGRLVKSFEDVKQHLRISGYVSNVTPTGVFVRFANEMTGLLLKQNLPQDNQKLPSFGFRRDQSISAMVLTVDRGSQRFLLTIRDNEVAPTESHMNKTQAIRSVNPSDVPLSSAIDSRLETLNDLTLGTLTKAKIVSVKETQLNMQLSDGVQGRVDVSEIFDTWTEIKDRKHPLKLFHPNQVLAVRVLGMHDSRNHKFLPISHRQGGKAVFELTAKKSSIERETLDLLTVYKLQVGSSWLVFVNNVKNDFVWVNLSPNVRGRIRSMDASDDISLLKNLTKSFPPGYAMRAKVVSVDVESGHIDLTARSDGSTKSISLQDLSPGMILPGRVTKVSDRLIMIQINEGLSGALHIIDMADDFALADPSIYQKNQALRVSVKEVNRPNKRVIFSTRPSRILNSSLAVKDPDITSVSQLQVDQVVRGFIKNVSDQGLFVSLSSSITAFVRVADLSDEYLKDWKSNFEVDSLVEGKILSIDASRSRIVMTLKRSCLDPQYQSPLTFNELKTDQTVTGKIRRIEEYGVFVVVDNSANVSGLCHRTQISDQPNIAPVSLFEVGDKVRAKILSIDEAKRQISFGLKTSYFENNVKGDQDVMETNSDISDPREGGVAVHHSSIKDNEDMKHSSHDSPSLDGQEDNGTITLANSVLSATGQENVDGSNGGLTAGGFDWSGGLQNAKGDLSGSDSDLGDAEVVPTKKHRKPQIKVDMTGNLDKESPQSASDFERLLLSQPNASLLWLKYMAFYLSLSDPTQAREIAERALSTIHIRDQDEKLNIWIGLLNLENTYGTPETLESAFQRACSYNDSQLVHERLTGIYIQSGQHEKADDLFQTSLRKFSSSPALYINYAAFLFDPLNVPDRARALLPRAMQTLPPHEHVNITAKFAQMEFRYARVHEDISDGVGDPERGRTMFETLLTQWPKRVDLWNVRLDMEISLFQQQLNAEAKERQGKSQGTKVNKCKDPSGGQAGVRNIFQRLTNANSRSHDRSAGVKLKPKQAKFFFKRWLAFEEKFGDDKSVEQVKARAAEYVRGLTDESEHQQE